MIVNTRYILSFFVTLILGVHGVHASEISLEQAVAIALKRSPEIQIAGEQKEQTVFAVNEAKAAYYPQVDVFAEAGREYNNPASTQGGTTATGGSNINNSAEATLSINQFIFDGFETQEEIARRDQLTTSAVFQQTRVEEQIILDTIKAYTALLQHQRATQDSEAFLSAMEEIERKMILMVEAGAESEAKMKFALARLASARQKRIGVQSNLADARTDLEQLIGEHPGFEAMHPSSSFIILEGLRDYFTQAQAGNKELLVHMSDKKALEHQLEGLYGQEYPRLNALVELNQTHDVGGEIGKDKNASAMLQLNYRLFDGFAADASRKRIMSQMREIDLRIEQSTRDINQGIKLLYNQLQSLKNEWLILEQEIDANDAVRLLNQEQFALGDADILELVESEERYFNSRIKKHQVEFDFTQTIHQLKRQTGQLKKEQFLMAEDWHYDQGQY